MTGGSFEYRVVLGTVGLSRGVHYWEASVDRRDNNADIVVGVALAEVSKQVMLGKSIPCFGYGLLFD